MRAGLNQAEIVQLLDRGFIAQYGSLFATSAANPHGEEMVGVIASMAWANISPNMIASLHLLDDAHLDKYAEWLNTAYDDGQYVSIGDLASCDAAGLTDQQIQQLLAERFFSTYGDLIEMYGAGWLAKIRIAYRGSPSTPGSATYTVWFQELAQIEDIPGAWQVAHDLAAGTAPETNPNKRWGTQFVLQWLASHTDDVAQIEVDHDGAMGPDALLTDGTLVELKSYKDPSNHVSEMISQLTRPDGHLDFAMQNGVTRIQYVFDGEFGDIPQSVKDRLQAAVDHWNQQHHTHIQLVITTYKPPVSRDVPGGFG